MMTVEARLSSILVAGVRRYKRAAHESAVPLESLHRPVAQSDSASPHNILSSQVLPAAAPTRTLE